MWKYHQSEAGNLTLVSDGKILFIRIIDMDTGKENMYMTDNPIYSEKEVDADNTDTPQSLFTKIDFAEGRHRVTDKPPKRWVK